MRYYFLCNWKNKTVAAFIDRPYFLPTVFPRSPKVHVLQFSSTFEYEQRRPNQKCSNQNSDLARQTIKKKQAKPVDSILSRGVRYRDSRVRAGELIYCDRCLTLTSLRKEEGIADSEALFSKPKESDVCS